MEEQALMVRVPEETKTDRDVFPSRDSGGPTQPVGPLPSSSCPATWCRLLLSAIGKKKNKGFGRFAEIFSDFRLAQGQKECCHPEEGAGKAWVWGRCVLMLDGPACLGMDLSCRWGETTGDPWEWDLVRPLPLLPCVIRRRPWPSGRRLFCSVDTPQCVTRFLLFLSR